MLHDKKIFAIAVCRNEERYIEKFILSIKKSTYPVQLVLVDLIGMMVDADLKRVQN